MKTKILKKAFTLIEILLVITLIGILLTIGLVNFNAEARFIETRNDARKNSVQTLESAITQYKLQEGSYPNELNRTYKEICDPDASSCSGYIDLKSILVPSFLQSIPQDPNDTDTTGGSGYTVAIDVSNNRVSVRAIQSESGVTIAVNDPLPDESTVVQNTPLSATIPKLSIVTDGLLLYLDAGNVSSYTGTGTIWNDLSINNNNGTLINTPTYNTNGYFDFDHTQSESVTFSNASSLQFLNRSPYTLESWVYPTRNPGLANYTGILDREDASMGYRNGYSLHFSTNTSNQPYFSTSRFSLENGIFNQSGTIVFIDSSSINNSWHHIVTTYDGTNISLYRNGSSIGAPVVSTGNITNTSKALTLGVRGGQYFGGRISNTRIYNRALTAAEVQQNFNATKGRFGL